MPPTRRAILPPLVLGALACLTSGTASSQDAPNRRDEPAKRTRTEQIELDVVAREAICSWATRPPVLDGKLDDPCWQDAPAIGPFASYWDNKTRRPGTRAYLAWDDEALYYAGLMTDTELRSYGKNRNDSLWDGDVFELFLKPSADRPEYYEFQANPKALVFECFFPKRGIYPKVLSEAPVLGNTAAVRLDGTLDHPGDTDVGWIVEGRIPWTAFRPTGGKPKPGDEWRFAICRYDYGPQGTKPITMSSAPLTKPNFHQHEDYGRLRFQGPRP